jgi:hypothetical protein
MPRRVPGVGSRDRPRKLYTSIHLAREYDSFLFGTIEEAPSEKLRVDGFLKILGG